MNTCPTLDFSLYLNENDYQYRLGGLFMLSDFLTLELYFGRSNGGLFYEDLLKHYGAGQIQTALKNGDIECRPVLLGPDCGRTLYKLSARGRAKLCTA